MAFIKCVLPGQYIENHFHNGKNGIQVCQENFIPDLIKYGIKIINHFLIGQRLLLSCQRPLIYSIFQFWSISSSPVLLHPYSKIRWPSLHSFFFLFQDLKDPVVIEDSDSDTGSESMLPLDGDGEYKNFHPLTSHS